MNASYKPLALIKTLKGYDGTALIPGSGSAFHYWTVAQISDPITSRRQRWGHTEHMTELLKWVQSQLFAWRLDEARDMWSCLHRENPCVTSKTQLPPHFITLPSQGDGVNMMLFTSSLCVTQHDLHCCVLVTQLRPRQTGKRLCAGWGFWRHQATDNSTKFMISWKRIQVKRTRTHSFSENLVIWSVHLYL